MSFFSIDAEKCVKDGLCVMDCPMSIFQMPDKNSARFRCLVAKRCASNARSLCFNLPTGAIAIESVS